MRNRRAGNTGRQYWGITAMNRSRRLGSVAFRSRLVLSSMSAKTPRDRVKPQAEIGDNVSPIRLLWLPVMVAGEPIPAHKRRSGTCDLMQVVHAWEVR
jgi:hypothetical protein